MNIKKKKEKKKTTLEQSTCHTFEKRFVVLQVLQEIDLKRDVEVYTGTVEDLLRRTQNKFCIYFLFTYIYMCIMYVHSLHTFQLYFYS